MMDPRSSAKFIAEHNTNVKIRQNGLQKTAKMIVDAIKTGKFHTSDWLSQELHPKTKDRTAVDWCFLVDTINFSFWTPTHKPKFCVSFHDKTWTGYFAACACVNRALESGIPITDPRFYAKISLQELREIFKGDNGIVMPMLTERKAALEEAANVLIEAEGSAKKLLEIVTRNFPSYRDTAIFKENKADVWGSLEGKGLADFPDFDELTMFADYRVPQILAYLGVLDYSKELINRLRLEDLFVSGEELEVELRGCTIHACELLVAEIKRIMLESNEQELVRVNAVTVDNFLWTYRRQIADVVENTVPFHRIRTIYY